MTPFSLLPARGSRRLQAHVNRRLWISVGLASVLGSGLMAVVAGVLALSTAASAVNQQIEREESVLSVFMTSFRPLYQLQRALQNAVTQDRIDQAMVVDQRGVVLASSDQALVGLPFEQVLALPSHAVLRLLYSDCPTASVLHSCLKQERQRFLGWLPWLGGDKLLVAHPYPLALEGVSRFGDRATLVTVVDLEHERRNALVFVLAAFGWGLLPMFASCLGLALIVRRALLPELINLAQVDPLSGVYNRRAFMEAASFRLRRAQELNQPAAIALIDIDFFKKINDTYGHDAGDRVIQAVTGLLQRAVRSSDVVGRLGGDEFVLLVQLHGDAALQACQRILEAVGEASIDLGEDVSAGAVSVGLSIGIAASDGAGGYVLQDLMEAADAALYVAKDRGRRQVVYLEGEMRSSAVAGTRLRPVEGWQIRGL